VTQPNLLTNFIGESVVKNNRLTAITVALFLASASLLASNAAFAAANVMYVAVADKAAAVGGTADTGETSSDLQVKLETARAKLEQAAREVAELSAQLGKPLMDKFMMLDGGPPRSIIGVQLDAASGKEGARVRDLSPGGPAAEAGVQAGDVIVAINGTDVKGDEPARQVLRLMGDIQPESKVKVRVLRDGKPRDFVIAARPGIGYMATREMPHPPGLPFEVQPFVPPLMFRGPLGDMELATLTPQLGRYFGTEKGVLVVRAPQEGGFKLEDGDVIVAIDGREPTSGSHATRILTSYQPEEKITMKLMRQHKTINVETTLPDRSEPERKVRMTRPPNSAD
jgi:S1-C subfamily serine protease